MSINLDRAEQIGGDYEPATEFKSDLLFGQIEVLNINKIPFDGVLKEEIVSSIRCISFLR